MEFQIACKADEDSEEAQASWTELEFKGEDDEDDEDEEDDSSYDEEDDSSYDEEDDSIYGEEEDDEETVDLEVDDDEDDNDDEADEDDDDEERVLFLSQSEDGTWDCDGVELEDAEGLEDVSEPVCELQQSKIQLECTATGGDDETVAFKVACQPEDDDDLSLGADWGKVKFSKVKKNKKEKKEKKNKKDKKDKKDKKNKKDKKSKKEKKAKKAKK